MDNDEFRSLLLRWQRYVVLDHRLPGLGIAQSAYAERTGTSYSASDPMQGFDPIVAKFHEFYKKELPPSVQQPIFMAYLVPGLEKTKYEPSRKAHYYTVLAQSIETARWMFSRTLEAKEAV